jgi:Family of unknown function (DUF6263)
MTWSTLGHAFIKWGLMRTRIGLIAAAAVTVALVPGLSGSTGAQDTTLRYRWTKGEEVRYRMSQESTATISGLPGGMADMTIDTLMSQVMKSVVEDIAADGTATIRQVYESVRMEVNSPMSKMAYDSTKKDNASADPTAQSMFSVMIGESFLLVLSPSGEVQKVDGMSRIMEKVFQNLPQDPAAAAMLNGMRNSFSDDAMRATLSQGFLRFPDRALKVGDTWDSQFSVKNPMIGGITTSVNATLKGFEGSGADQVAKIAMKLTMKPDSEAAATNPMGLTVKMGDGSGEGEMVFNVAKGRQQRAVNRMNTSLTMSGSGPDGSVMNMQTLVKATVTLELVQ